MRRFNTLTYLTVSVILIFSSAAYAQPGISSRLNAIKKNMASGAKAAKADIRKAKAALKKKSKVVSRYESAAKKALASIAPKADALTRAQSDLASLEGLVASAPGQIAGLNNDIAQLDRLKVNTTRFGADYFFATVTNQSLPTGYASQLAGLNSSALATGASSISGFDVISQDPNLALDPVITEVSASSDESEIGGGCLSEVQADFETARQFGTRGDFPGFKNSLQASKAKYVAKLNELISELNSLRRQAAAIIAQIEAARIRLAQAPIDLRPAIEAEIHSLLEQLAQVRREIRRVEAEIICQRLKISYMDKVDDIFYWSMPAALAQVEDLKAAIQSDTIFILNGRDIMSDIRRRIADIQTKIDRSAATQMAQRMQMITRLMASAGQSGGLGNLNSVVNLLVQQLGALGGIIGNNIGALNAATTGMQQGLGALSTSIAMMQGVASQQLPALAADVSAKESAFNQARSGIESKISKARSVKSQFLGLKQIEASLVAGTTKSQLLAGARKRLLTDLSASLGGNPAAGEVLNSVISATNSWGPLPLGLTLPVSAPCADAGCLALKKDAEAIATTMMTRLAKQTKRSAAAIDMATHGTLVGGMSYKTALRTLKRGTAGLK